MKYILPLSPDYVSEWSDWHAVRELLQNAMDAHTAGGEHPVMDYDGHTLMIASPRERLSRKTLLLGSTSKANDPQQRGKFGEGYKLALLVFCRKLYDVTIINGGEVWRPSFEACPDFDNAPVLTINIEPTPTDAMYDGIRFLIRGFPQEAWNTIQSRWLPDVPNDTILDYEERGNVYCGGLFITKANRLLRGYNFAPSRLNLGRDRDIVGDFDVQFQTSMLWSQCPPGRVNELMNLMNASAADVEYVTHVPEQSRQLIVREYEKQYGEHTVPVKDQKELDRVRAAGFNGQIVCDALRTLVAGVKKFVYHELRTPGGQVKAFYDKFKDGMNLDAREALEILVQESVKWR